MASASRLNPSSSKPPRHPSPITTLIPTKPNIPEESQFQNPNSITTPSTSISMSIEDQILKHSTHLTHPELLKRRSHNLKQLAKCYRDHYWALMEDLKSQHRDYYWKFGLSPFKEDNHHENKRRKIEGESCLNEIDVEGSGDNANNNGGSSSNGVNLKGNCLACGNKSKAMALTNYCQLHILLDKKQKLYKSCTYVTKRAQSKAITCPKPTLASTVPALCTTHFQKAQKDVAKALKDAGHHNVSSTSKLLPPKLHDIVAAFVHHIQEKKEREQTKNLSKRRNHKLKSNFFSAVCENSWKGNITG